MLVLQYIRNMQQIWDIGKPPLYETGFIVVGPIHKKSHKTAGMETLYYHFIMRNSPWLFLTCLYMCETTYSLIHKPSHHPLFTVEHCNEWDWRVVRPKAYYQLPCKESLYSVLSTWCVICKCIISSTCPWYLSAYAWSLDVQYTSPVVAVCILEEPLTPNLSVQWQIRSGPLHSSYIYHSFTKEHSCTLKKCSPLVFTNFLYRVEVWLPTLEWSLHSQCYANLR